MRKPGTTPSAAPSRPAASAPPMPTRMVMPIPIGSGPGRASRASAPRMSPWRTAAMMSEIMLRWIPARAGGDAGTRRPARASLRTGPGEEVVADADGPGGHAGSAQRVVGGAGHGAGGQHLAVGVHRRAPERAVDDPRALAALGDRGDHERLARAGVAAGEDVLAARREDGGADVAADVEVEPEVGDRALVLGVEEADGEERDVGLDRELAAGHGLEVARGGALDLAGMDALQPAV